jgi:hypothetical protein
MQLLPVAHTEETLKGKRYKDSALKIITVAV